MSKLTPAQFQEASTLLVQVLQFTAPADALLSAHFRHNPKLGGQDLGQLPPALEQLAALLSAQGKSQEAEQLYEQTVQGVRRALGDSHRALGQMLHDFGDFLNFRQGKFDAAAEQYLDSLPIRVTASDALQILRIAVGTDEHTSACNG